MIYIVRARQIMQGKVLRGSFWFFEFKLYSNFVLSVMLVVLVKLVNFFYFLLDK